EFRMALAPPADGKERVGPLVHANYEQLGVDWIKSGTDNAKVTRFAFLTSTKSPIDVTMSETFFENPMRVEFSLDDWWGVKSDDPSAAKYRDAYRTKQRAQAYDLRDLTGWNIDSIMGERLPGEVSEREVMMEEYKKETAELEKAAEIKRQQAKEKALPMEYILLAGIGVAACIGWVLFASTRGPKGGSGGNSAAAEAKKKNITAEFEY